jgi:putative Mg2+ transporter-C (MgtC) family protein
MVLRLLLSACLGSVIGFERERLLWAAGLRTHMLVCVGSCLMILVSAYGFSSVLSAHVILDPSRVAAQVVSGIGFLGAGSIILRNEAVKGLTTAASVWAVAGVGLATGAGLYTAAIASTLIVLAILAGLKPLVERYHASRNALELRFEVRRGALTMTALEAALGGRTIRVKQFVVQPSDHDQQDDVTLILTRVSPKDTADIVLRLGALPGVSDVREAGR